MSTPASTKRFWDSIWSPRSRGFFLAWPAPLKPPSGCWRNSDFWWIDCHVSQTWICWTSLSYAFCRQKVQAMPHSNLAVLRQSITAEWDRLAAIYIRKTCQSFHHRQEAAAKKNDVWTDWMISQQPSSHQPILFRPKRSFNMTWGPTNWREKNILVHDWPPHPVCTWLLIFLCRLKIKYCIKWQTAFFPSSPPAWSWTAPLFVYKTMLLQFSL